MSKYDVALEVYQEFDNADEDGELVFSDWLHGRVEEFKGETGRTVWVLESTYNSGSPLYISASMRDEEPRDYSFATISIHSALQFETKNECLKWFKKWRELCLLYMYEPVEHRIG